jgi:curved DNA-binding protein CbpA
VVAGDDPDQQILVEALLVLLRQVGYVHFSGRPFGAEATEKMEGFVKELHRLSRMNHFVALGLEPKAGDKEIRKALRDRSLLYHPDTLFDQHPRVLETASVLQARIQEAYDVLKDPDARSAYREEVEESGEQVADEAAAKIELARGKIKLRHKHYALAVEAFRDATLLDPGSVEAKVKLAWTSFLADPSEPRRAMGEMSRIVKEHDGQPDPWYYLGRLSLLQKDHGRARRYFNKAIGYAPDHVEANRELRLMDRRGQAVPKLDPVDGEQEVEANKPKGLLARLRGR